MLKLQILVAFICTASLTDISEQAVLTCDGGNTPFFSDDDVRVVDGYPRPSRNDLIFLGSDQNLTVINGTNYTTEELGVCYSQSVLGCYKAGSNMEDCDNYIRGVTVLDGACNDTNCRVFVCGTNALLPRCTFCNYTGLALNCSFVENDPPQDLPYNATVDDGYSSCFAENINGQGVFQLKKNHNATFLFDNTNGRIYYGLVKENSNPNSIIGLASINQISGEITDEVTTRTDSQKMVATEAHFVGKPFIDGGFVYFLFREPAQEFASLTEGQSNEINTYYSRIARICKNDDGTDVSSARILTSFLKQRLVCSQMDSDGCPLEYNEIQDFVFSDGMIRAIFTNNQNDLPASALCVFDLAAIIETFNTGSFFGADGGTTNDLWRENTGSTISPRPGLNCSNPNTGNTNFERDYNLMNDVQTSDVSVFMEGDRFSSLEMPEEDIYIIASEKGCLYQVNISDTGTNETDLGDPCEMSIVLPPAPIKDLELAPDNSYLVTTLDNVYVLSQCNESDETGGEEGTMHLCPPPGIHCALSNSIFQFVANFKITGPPFITASGTQIEDYLVLKNESLDTTDTLFLTRILILNDTLVEFRDGSVPHLQYMIKPCKKYTLNELQQRCDEWDQVDSAYAYLNAADTCESASTTNPGTFKTSDLLEKNQVQDCANYAYSDCTDTCPP